jgi:hypothetical protein
MAPGSDGEPADDDISHSGTIETLEQFARTKDP